MLNKIISTYKTWSYMLRRKYYTAIALRRVKIHGKIVNVNNKSFFTVKCEFGNNVNFNGMKVKGFGKVSFGDNFHSGQECLIITHNHNYNGEMLPYDNTYIYKDVTIEDNVWLGDRVLILGGVKIGEGAIIQAGAVVVRDIPSLAIAGGNPATPFKYRDSEKYYRLKSEKKFN